MVSKVSVDWKAHQESVGPKASQASAAALEAMGNVERMAKTELLETGARKDRRVLLVPVGSPDRKVTMASV